MASDLEKLAQLGSMTATGGYAQAALGGAQAIYGLSQLPKAKAEFERAKASAPSLDTPSQFYENYRNAYDSELARMQNDAIQANLATSVQALQGAGGRALVGGLSQATAQSQMAQNQMLAQERQMRMAAGQQLAQAEQATIGRKEARSQQEMAYANQAYQAALGNIGGGLASAGEGLMYGLSTRDTKSKQGASEQPRDIMKEGFSKETIAETQKLQDNLDLNDVKLQSIQAAEEAEVSEDFIGNLAALEDNRNQASAANAKAGILPRINTRFQAGKAMRQTTVGDIGGVGTSGLQSKSAPSFSAPGLSAGYQLPAVSAPQKEFGGSAIPAEFRNDQAMKQINALSRMYDKAAPVLNSLSPVTPKPAGANQLNDYIPMLRSAAFFRNGGMMTEGSFDHNSNPIDLIQNGEKVGEATGGEYILNPKQAAAIKKESSYAKKLFKKFEKNAKKKK